MDVIKETIKKEKKSVKQVRSKMALGQQQITSLKDKIGEVIKCRDKLVKKVEEFYKELYASKTVVPIAKFSVNTSEIPEVTPDEVNISLKNIKRGKTSDDGITADLLLDAGGSTKQARLLIYSVYKKEENYVTVILLYKKGDSKDLSNYQPIS